MNKIAKQSLLAWTMLLSGLVATAFTSLHVKHGIDDDAARQFSFTCDQITLKIRERLRAYVLTLRGGAALFEASHVVSRQEWAAYTETLRAQDSIPGVQGIGFALVIPPDQLASHIASIRSEGFPDYTVRPAGERSIYTSIVYLEPFRDRNLRAFGYDMFSEPVRRAAMEQARDSGEVTLSGKVQLIQETETQVQAGTLMYVPVYRRDTVNDTVERRRAALMGWVYSPYRMNDLMSGILGDWVYHEGQSISLKIYDGKEISPSALLFASQKDFAVDAKTSFQQRREIDFNGRQWLLAFDRDRPEFYKDYFAAWMTLAGGLTLSGLLFALMMSVINTQANAARIANNLTQEIRRREQLLTESEYRWRFALEGSGDGVWDWDVVNERVFFSKRWKEMLGFADHEIGNGLDEWTSRIHPDDKMETLTNVQAYFDGKIPLYACEHRVRCKDGSWKWILDRGMVVSRDEHGKPLRMIGTHSDITDRKRLEESLRQNQKDLLAAQRIAQMGSWRLDLVSNQVIWSEELYRMFGLDPAQPTPEFNEQRRLFTASSWDRLNEAIVLGKENGLAYELELEMIRADGRSGWMWARGEAIRDTNGAIIGLQGVAADITQRKQTDLMLKAAHREAQRFREALDYVTSYIYMKDTESRYLYANRATLDLFGVTSEELAGCDDSCFFPADTAKRLREIDERVFQGEQTSEEIDVNPLEGGRRVYLEIKTPLYEEADNKTICGLLGISTNITTLKEHEKYLEHIAHYDALTGLANRVLLADRLHQAMAQALRRGQQLAVAYIDLDGFKIVNDSYGHDAGDHLLIAVAANMKRALREGDSLARLGGDEFVAVLIDLADEKASESMLLRLLTAAAEPMQYGDRTLQVSASLGVTFYPQQEDVDADQLLRQADHAMYQAKLAGKNHFHIFDIEKDRLARGYHDSLERIRRALFEREFILYYQPKVNMRTGCLIGVEALIRWRHPERGLLSPAVFLPVIEEHQLAIDVGEWVIDTALNQMEQWREAGLNIPISVNIGARQLQQSNFVERLRILLATHPGVDPSYLELEVLETSALADLAQVCKVIDECREIGVRFALDDFGTGYSSLTYLKRLSADMLKIDQSFVRDMLDDPEDLAILEGVLGLATAFRRQAIAEGVETSEHGEMLLRLGCDLAQGYGIARPMPAEQLPDWAAVWKPEPQWLAIKPISRVDLPLLYAGVELRAWARAFEASLADEYSPPPQDLHRCRFGLWLDSGGLMNKGQPESRQAVESLHQRLHQIATELYTLKVGGSTQALSGKMDEFHAIRNVLLARLNALDCAEP